MNPERISKNRRQTRHLQDSSIVYLSNHVDLNPTKTTEERRNKFYHQHITFSKIQRRQKSAGVANAEEISSPQWAEEESCKNSLGKPQRETSSQGSKAPPSGPRAVAREARKRLLAGWP